MIQRIYTDDELCDAVGPHHGDRCSNGRIQSPNAQFTRECEVCKGSGLRQKKASDNMSKFKLGDDVRFGDYPYRGMIVGGERSENGRISHLIKSDDGRTYSIPESHLSLWSEPCVGEANGTLAVSDPGFMTVDAPNKYARKLYPLEGPPVQIDVYRVLDAFGVTDPAIQHAAKKLLMPGGRGPKGIVQDLEEAVFSIRQAIELMKQKGGG